MSFLVGLCVFGVVVLLHELGHFIAAKALGIPAPVLSIGFGPSFARFTFRETEYRLCWLPFGGYVLAGDPDDPSAFGAWKRFAFYAAGPAASFLTGLVIWQDLALCLEHATEAVVFLAGLFSGASTLADVAGPIGISAMAGEAASDGASSLIDFVAGLSISLGVFNLLPLPVLDGGEMLLAGLQGIFRRELPTSIRRALTLVGYVVLLAFALRIAGCDIARLASAPDKQPPTTQQP
jgi:regulator of sigma E protease